MKNYLTILGLLFTLIGWSQNINFYKKKYNCTTDTSAIIALIDDYKKVRNINIDSAAPIIETARKLSLNCKNERIICSAMYYQADAFVYLGDYQQSNKCLDTVIKLSEKNGYYKQLADALNFYGINYSDQGNYPKSLEYYEKAKNIAVKNGFKTITAKTYTNIGVTYYFQGDLNKAIEYYLKSTKIVEELKDSATLAVTLANLAVFYQEKGQLDKSLEMLEKAKLWNPPSESFCLSDIFNNMAVTYSKKKDYEKAIAYYIRSIDIKKSLNDYKGIAQGFHNLADIYNSLKNYTKAEEYQLQAISILKDKEIPMMEATTLRGLANIYFEKKEYTKALLPLQKSLEISLKIDYKTMVCDNYFLLADVYRGMGNFEKSTEYMFLYQSLNDSLQKAEFAENIAEMEAKYQNEKNQKEIELLQADKKNQQLEIERRRLFQKALFIGLALAFILIFVITLSYFQKKKANRILQEKNHEILQQKEEITAQRDEIAEKNEILIQHKEEIEAQRDEILLKNELLQQQNEEITAQRDEIEDQKKIIEEKNHEVMDSIRYAKRIQNAVLPSLKVLQNNSLDGFIFFRPRDIVSGDFYFVKKTNNYLIAAVADCTGHGVPGAFMSMLGHSLLNEITQSADNTSAGIVLNELREALIQALHNKKDETNKHHTEVKDGMDISLVFISRDTNTIQYAGANNPLYYVSNNGNLEEIKPDKMPVALYPDMRPFTNKVINFSTGDCIYLCSDGYQDQFGGPQGKKFYAKNLRAIMQANYHKPIDEQYCMFDNTMETWKKPEGFIYEQTDDITVMGIKL